MSSSVLRRTLMSVAVLTTLAVTVPSVAQAYPKVVGEPSCFRTGVGGLIGVGKQHCEARDLYRNVWWRTKYGSQAELRGAIAATVYAYLPSSRAAVDSWRFDGASAYACARGEILRFIGKIREAKSVVNTSVVLVGVAGKLAGKYANWPLSKVIAVLTSGVKSAIAAAGRVGLQGAAHNVVNNLATCMDG